MKPTKQALNDLLASARSAPPSKDDAPESDVTLPLGLATRIAARWSAGDDRALNLALLERVTACCLLPALATWAVLAWSPPAHAEPNVMELLYRAELVVETPPPF